MIDSDRCVPNMKKEMTATILVFNIHSDLASSNNDYYALFLNLIIYQRDYDRCCRLPCPRSC